VKAQLKLMLSDDIPGRLLEKWAPLTKDFGIHVMLFIGCEDDENFTDIFDLLICTPGWFETRLEKTLIESGQHTLLVKEYDYESIKSYIENYIERSDGSSWPEIASKLGRLAEWEFQTRLSDRPSD
jgi:Immunity protein 8